MKTIICYEAIVNGSNERIQGFFYAKNLDDAEKQCRDHAKERHGKVCDSVVVAYANQFNDIFGHSRFSRDDALNQSLEGAQSSTSLEPDALPSKVPVSSARRDLFGFERLHQPLPQENVALRIMRPLGQSTLRARIGDVFQVLGLVFQEFWYSFFKQNA